MLVLTLVAGLSSCSTSSYRLLLGADDWTEAMQSEGVRSADLANPLETDTALVEVALSVAGSGTDFEKLRRLQTFLFDEETFLFDYRIRQTQTALEAYASRSGNCVSFTNLFIALGRAAGVPVQAALAWTGGESETVGDLVLVNSHVVAAYRHSQGRTIYDFDRNRERDVIGYRLIDDYQLNAIFLNNLAVEKLIEGEIPAATTYFEDALRLDSEFVEAFSNLGVSLQRAGETEAALDAYLLALQIEPTAAARYNLRGLYAQMARDRLLVFEEGATQPASEVETLLARGDEALSLSRVHAAVGLYRQALDVDPKHPAPHVALARILLFQGRVRSAKKHLRRALEIAPSNAEARRLLDGLSREQGTT